MSEKLVILIVEDEIEVRQVLERDIACFRDLFDVESCEDAEEASEVVEELLTQGQEIALVLCDHVLPGRQGVDFLIDLEQTEATEGTRKVLVTGQAGLDETVRALNEGNLDRYVAKPWKAEELQEVVREQLTAYVVEYVQDLLPYTHLLNSETILLALRERASDH